MCVRVDLTYMMTISNDICMILKLGCLKKKINNLQASAYLVCVSFGRLPSLASWVFPMIHKAVK